MRNVLKIGILLCLAAISACTKINTSQTMRIFPDARFGVATFVNNTEVPQAGYRAMSITANVLRSRGVRSVSVFPVDPNCKKLIVCPNAVPPLSAALSWARRECLSFLMLGTVNEWDYKVGLDGEPIAGVALQLYEVKSGALVWSSVGSKIGTSRSGLAVIAQRLIEMMLGQLYVY